MTMPMGRREALHGVPGKENAAADGPRNGAESVDEVRQLPKYDSPAWHGAPDIIARHFAGVLGVRS